LFEQEDSQFNEQEKKQKIQSSHSYVNFSQNILKRI